MPRVQHIIYMDQPNKRPKLDGFPSNVQIHSLSSVEQMGATPENSKYTLVTVLIWDPHLKKNTSERPGMDKSQISTRATV